MTQQTATNHAFNALCIVLILCIALAFIWNLAGILPSELTGH